jgi:hypothetical protein
MNKEIYNQIIDEAYEDYCNHFLGYDDVPTKDVFVFDCKTDKDFSERFGLKIEERELTYLERYKLWFGNNYETGMEYNENIIPDFDNEYYEPTPTKLITVTYKNKTIEIYE